MAANKAENEMYKYQEAALEVFAKGKQVQDLKKDDLKALVRFGVKLKDRCAPFTEILKKNLSSLCDYYCMSSTSRISLKTKIVVALRSRQSRSQSPTCEVSKRHC
jgi:hypothetical protein